MPSNAYLKCKTGGKGGKPIDCVHVVGAAWGLSADLPAYSFTAGGATRRYYAVAAAILAP